METEIETEIEFESCVRCDTAVLEFSTSFTLYMCEENIINGTDSSCDFFCMGWEI